MNYPLSFFHIRTFKRTLVALYAAWGCTNVQATNIDTEAFNRLNAIALTKGSVPVNVLLTTATLDDIAQRASDVLTKTQEKANSLIVSLGGNALPEGRHINPLGSVDLLVTAQGLELLRQSPFAISIREGDEWHRNILLPDLDGSLEAIDADLNKRGFSVVEISLDVEGAEYDIDRQNGQSKLSLTAPTLQRIAQQKATAVLAGLGLTPNAQGKTLTVDARLSLIDDKKVTTHGHLVLKVDRRALFDLARNPHVLAIKPVGHKDHYPFVMDKLALEAAQKNGLADVLIQLRLPFVSGQSNEETRSAHTRSHQRMLDDILTGIQPQAPVQSFARLGGLNAKLSFADLEKLKNSNDARILGISLNRPLFKPSLFTSTASMNLSGVSGQWSKGYKGAGQTIIVMDSGIEKNHVMFKRANGTSKIIGEACFQTNSVFSLASSYQSKCPSPDGNGDSFPVGLVLNAGEPFSNDLCSIGDDDFKKRYCSHGTHVASIAAGRYSAQMSPQLQGVAPDADLISINVYSPILTEAFGGRPKTIDANLFPSDFIAATNVLDQMLSLTGSNQPYVINMSLGGASTGNPVDCNVSTLTQEDCTAALTPTLYPFRAAVIRLKGKGVPVIAAMGNNNAMIYSAFNTTPENNNSKMDIPAAVPGVIKVGAVDNSISAITMPNYSNRVRPELWPGEHIFLAPGGFPNTGILAATAYGGGISSGLIEGTSMATPHVSGVFAILKSIIPSNATLNDVLSFMENPANQMTYPVTAIACDPNDFNPCTTTRAFKALRLCYGSTNSICP